MKVIKYGYFWACILSILLSSKSVAADFVEIVEQNTQSVVAIAVNAPIKSAAPQIKGTGFIVGDGSWAVTNYHVVSEPLDPTIVEDYVILVGQGSQVEMVKGTVEKIDPAHDIALLKLPKRFTPVTMSEQDMLKPGSEIAFTGFPIGAVLGLYPATHRGYIAAVTPDAIPAMQSDQLTLEMMKRLAHKNLIYQLDATAYPGNSGSPVYDPVTGDVVAIINKVIVRDTKESALSSPSGISYAVPVKYISTLLTR